MLDIKRMEHITLVLEGDSKYSILNKNKELLLSSDEDYFIYLRNVKFLNGKIEGKFLGELHEKSAILSGENKDVTISNGRFFVEGKLIKRARMIAINNKNNTIIIISG